MIDMYVEFKPGKKHAGANPEYSDDINAFEDAGYLLQDNEIVIDIDVLTKDQISEYLKRFEIETQVVWTERGAHLYFSKPPGLNRSGNKKTPLGFPVEYKTSKNTKNGITIKRFGILRKIDNEGKRAPLPWYFKNNKSFPDLVGLSEGSRNESLMQFNMKLTNEHAPDREIILRFINEVLFEEPLEESEFLTVSREMPASGEQVEEYGAASKILEKNRVLRYQGDLWFWSEGEFKSDPEDNERLRKIIIESFPGKKTMFYDEVLKQLYYRAEVIRSKEFAIRLNNGVLRKGRFEPLSEYLEFTPYFVRIDYKEDADVVEEVDDYIDQLTDSDPEYRKLILEAMAYPFILNKTMIQKISKFFLIMGSGSNGKSTLINIMRKIYGDCNCTALSPAQLADERYAVTMVGKLANLGDDIPPSPIDNNQMKMLKNITTADEISVRKLYKHSQSVSYTLKLFFTANTMIKTFEKGYAFQRRIMVLPMYNKVVKPDPDFFNRMTTRDALIYWMRLIVEAYFRLYKNKNFSECEKVENFTSNYHKENNYMSAFVEAMMSDKAFEKADRLTAKQVHGMYDDYNDDSSQPYNRKLLLEALAEVGVVEKIGKVNDKSVRMYCKIE